MPKRPLNRMPDRAGRRFGTRGSNGACQSVPIPRCAAAADVLGFSYGGLIAQLLALTAPGRIRRLIIASSSILPVPRMPSKDGPNGTSAWQQPPSRPGRWLAAIREFLD